MECRVGAVAGLACLVAACVAAPSRSSVAAPEILASDAWGCEHAASELEALVYYAERVRLLPPAALEREHAERERGFREEASLANRIRLAVLLGLRHAPFRDDARARLLLRQASRQPGHDAEPYRSLAALLLQQLDERHEMETMLAGERKERQALRRKLEQLKAIEEEIDRRMPPVIQPR